MKPRFIAMILMMTLISATVVVVNNSSDTPVRTCNADDMISANEVEVATSATSAKTTIPSGKAEICMNKIEYDEEYDNEIVVEEEKEELVVKEVDETYYVKVESLNARSEPTVESDVITVLNRNDEVHAVGELEDITNWIQIEVEGDIMYVATAYLSEERVIEEKIKSWDGIELNSDLGKVYGPNGYETYYNLDMTKIIKIMRDKGYTGEYWVRDDGCKMLGDYIMIAADLKKYPRGTLVETSLGTGIVVDTGEFVSDGSGVSIDVAVTW